jgi:hypothetical protein
MLEAVTVKHGKGHEMPALRKSAVKDDAAQAAQDAASHGYNGRDGAGANLLRECARAVRIGARNVERTYSVPMLGADERAEYASELAAWLIGQNGGTVPGADDLTTSYIVRRAVGLILNDRQRRGFDLTQPAEHETGADARLDGLLSVPAEIAAAASALAATETGRRAFIAALVPASREEWADFYGYASPSVWHRTAKRGRAELRSIGEDALCQALRRAETDATDHLDMEASRVREIVDGMEES